MSQALYRKYRPKTFGEVVSQDHVVSTLKNEIASKNFAHAYMFSGPRGTGKTSIARLLAKAINADSIKKHSLEDSTLIDIVEIDAASHTGVDNVRENVIQNAYVLPTQLEYKIFIIDEVHMLSVSAFNALLKILEEPPAHVIFILATTEIHKVPATVISRCQRFDFHTIGLVDTVKRLQYICEKEKVQVDDSVLERIARRSGGAIRDAESMLGQVLSIDSTHITDEQADIVLPRTNMALVLELFDALIQKQPQKYLAGIQQAVHDGMNLRELHATIMQVLRQCMLYTVDKSLEHFSTLDVHVEVHQQLVTMMSSMTTQDCLQLIDLFFDAGNNLSQSRIPQLPLEIAGIAWCQGMTQHTSEQSLQGNTPAGTPVRPQDAIPAVPASIKKIAQHPVKDLGKDSKNTSAMAAVEIVHNQESLTTGSIDEALTKTITSSWADVIRRVRVQNHSLAMILSVAHVIGVASPNILQIGVRFDFHKERLCEPENMKIIQDVLMDMTQHTLRIECDVNSKYEVNNDVLATVPSDNIQTITPAETENVWDLALSTFEGEEVST